MSDRVPPVTAAAVQRRAGRRMTDPRIVHETPEEEPAASPAGSNLPAALPLAPEEPPAGAAVEAQILGQDGQKRGLRGGRPVLDHARSAYLGAEYSGAADRRPPRGLIAKTEV
jgi:hypothetical protein